MASTKNDSPSNANGRPSTSPKRPIRPGHSRPISKLRTVPETAPIANKTADTLAHRLASRSAIRVVANDPAPVHHENHGRERHPETRQDDVPTQRDSHLFSRRQKPGRPACRQHHHRIAQPHESRTLRTTLVVPTSWLIRAFYESPLSSAGGFPSRQRAGVDRIPRGHSQGRYVSSKRSPSHPR